MFDEVNDEALDRWICTVYNRYIEWFGQPRDPDWRMTVVHARTDACARLLLGREYVICLRVDYESDEQRKAATAHEIYHRVVWRNPGIRKIPWVDEMLAFLASDHMLRLDGLEDYADHRKSVLVSAKCDLPFDRLVRFRRPLKPTFWPGKRYPSGFGEAVAQIGVELESLVGWDAMCRIVHCINWSQWLESIPHNVRGEVRRILHLPEKTTDTGQLMPDPAPKSANRQYPRHSGRWSAAPRWRVTMAEMTTNNIPSEEMHAPAPPVLPFLVHGTMTEKELRPIADQAYARCCEWFGAPCDAHWPYSLKIGDALNMNTCQRVPWSRRYVISIQGNRPSVPEYYHHIAHEMYHRVTMTRKGLRKTIWVDEMLANLAADHFVSERGYAAYIQNRNHYPIDQSAAMDLSGLQKVTRLVLMRTFGQSETLYPSGFSAGIIRLGAALQVLVRWSDLCRLVSCRRWDEWLDLLTPQRRPLVARLLGLTMSVTPGQAPMDAKSHRLMGYALYQLGDYEAALAECEAALRGKPDDLQTHTNQAIIFGAQKNWPAAIEVWKRRLQLHPDGTTYYNLGVAYWKSGHLPAAIDHYTEALRLEPNNNDALYSLGTALRDSGDLAGARAAWQQLSQVGDSYNAAEARARLEELPERSP